MHICCVALSAVLAPTPLTAADAVEEPEPYEITLDVAPRALNQQLGDRTDGALFYHANDVSPDWTASMTKTAKVGPHVFHRETEPARL